jgi:radical SAM protein with 4Fe4S-binding SPASM domain
LNVLREIRAHYDPHQITVALSGGEPLCYPGVFELGKTIHTLEFPWGMVTNGYAWTPQTIRDAAAAGMDSVTVSLDGLAGDHDWLRGRKGSFAKAVNAIRLLIANPFYQKMDIVTCVNRRNLTHLEELHDLIVDLRVTHWRLFTISPIGRAETEPDLLLDGTQFRSLLKTIVALKQRRQIEVNYSEAGYLGGQFEHTVRDHFYFCQAGISVAGIMVNGDILACPNIDRRFRQGNVHADSFVDVWENRYQQFRTRDWMKQGECVSCREWDSCKGNSFHLWDIDRCRTKVCQFRLVSADAEQMVR